MIMYRTLVFSILPALLLGTVDAQAHASLDRANPPVGSITRSAPRELALWFSQNLESAFNSVEVVGPAGNRVDQGRPKLDGADRTLLHVGLKSLPPGTYRVHWRVLSVDTHRTEGSFSFNVGQ